ncbi:hypothetical protein GCM10022243_23360 [Saccharothrix violaceirubra]|uniref:Uncharacterized protein n=1 Tax=Saccharothrix violaceirubra TaxID=413306 RepID=A0A7W7T197_9PSEU|nr:hypothetical protein [Saccharothrix violaceirubra]MBB4964724.1 hypothetical protein [Saccharothrix violaceirubra]
MKTEVVSHAGLVPEQLSPLRPDPVDVLEVAVERVLAAVRPSNLADPLAGTRNAEESLMDALRRTAHAGPTEAVACAEAAAEHLRYGELQEARLLLTAARGELARRRG